MRTLKTILIPILILLTGIGCNTKKGNPYREEKKKVVIAYVTSWSNTIPDPTYITHINYAFGHVNDSFDGVRISNEERLKQITALKRETPSLKVLLSIGGWGSGRFCEMAADETHRRSFAADCKRVIHEFDLDGIDIDWEYPTSSMANISSSPEDTQNYTLLMRDIRAAIGKEMLLTQATVASAQYIDFKAIDPYIDFTNIMAYDMASSPKHHAALYRSENAGGITSDEAVKAHLAAGVPPQKLVLGMPFYGRADESLSHFTDYKKIEKLTGYTRKWDDTAQVPYLTNDQGLFVCGYDDPQSLAIKCQYILDNGLLGAMYWDYDGDNEAGNLRQTVYNSLNK
ncbi:glycoside hydrolase [Parabacteroides sp. 52]|nr:chitinase [Parabacteroides sp. PM5-20]NDV54356.1 glycoside hydrolase [Parabacteroides sp. 52]